MDILRKCINRLRIILGSNSVADIFNNTTWTTFDYIAALPLLLYILSPALVLIYAFQVQMRLFIVMDYPVFLKSILPGILTLYALTIIILIGKRRKLTIQPVYMLFVFAMLWMLLSLCTNQWTDISLTGDSSRHEGLLTYWGYIGVLFFLGSLICDDHIKKCLCNLSIAVSLAVAIFAIYQFYVLPEDPIVEDAYPTAIFTQFNHYGYYLAMHIMMAAAFFTVSKTRIRKLTYLLAMVANVIVLNVNNTFGAWLACVFGFAFMFIVSAVKDKRFNMEVVEVFGVFVAISAGMTLCGCGIMHSLLQFFTDIHDVAEDPSKADAAGTTRWLLWKTTAGYIVKRPWFGYGIEGIDDMLQEATGSSRTHNEYLQYAATFGIPEAIAYTAGCVMVFIRNVKYKKALREGSFICLTVAFTYLVSAFFGITMYNTAPFLFIFMGLGFRSERDDIA